MVCQTFELCVITYAYKKQRSQRSEQNKTGVHVSGLCTMACLGADHLRDDLGNHCRYSMRACKMLLRKVTSLVIMNNLTKLMFSTMKIFQFNKNTQPWLVIQMADNDIHQHKISANKCLTQQFKLAIWPGTLLEFSDFSYHVTPGVLILPLDIRASHMYR